MTSFEAGNTPQESAEIDAIFAELTRTDDSVLAEKAAVDPYIEHARQRARDYNEILVYEGRVLADEAFSIQQELDAKWIGLTDAKVNVTGTVHTEEDGETVAHIVTGTEMKSRGFTVRGTSHDNEEGGLYFENPRAQFAFTVGRAALDASATGKRGEKKVWVYADVDDVLVEAKTVSTERAAAWVESKYPELFEEINARVFNADGGEADSLISLKGLDLAEYAPIDDDFTRECIQSYIEDVVDIDVRIFYSLCINGAYEVKDLGGYKREELNQLLSEGALAYAGEFKIDCEIGENRPDRWAINVNFALAPPHKNAALIQIRTSLDAIKSMQSIRAAYYGS